MQRDVLRQHRLAGPRLHVGLYFYHRLAIPTGAVLMRIIGGMFTLAALANKGRTAGGARSQALAGPAAKR